MVPIPGTTSFSPLYLHLPGAWRYQILSNIMIISTLHIEFLSFLTSYPLHALCRNALLFSDPQISFPPCLLARSFLLSPCSMRVTLTCQTETLNIFISPHQGKHTSGPIHFRQVASPSPLQPHSPCLNPYTFNSTRAWEKSLHLLPSCIGVWEPPMGLTLGLPSPGSGSWCGPLRSIITAPQQGCLRDRFIPLNKTTQINCGV